MTPLATCVDGGLKWHTEWIKLSYAYKVDLRSIEYTAGAEVGEQPTNDKRDTQVTNIDKHKNKSKRIAFVQGKTQRGSRERPEQVATTT